MRLPEPYKLADLMMEKLTRQILRRKNEAKKNLNYFGFDELNVLREMNKLYDGIDDDCRMSFFNLYCERYTELWLYLKGKGPREDTLDELVDMYLAGLWDDPNEVTKYAFEPELIRKRDRAEEAILSVPTKIQKQIEMDHAARYVSQQVGFYVDIVSQEAELQAYKDAGVKKVRWNIYGDDRVCEDCYKLNGKVFNIDKVPNRPHPRCRCYLTPV